MPDFLTLYQESCLNYNGTGCGGRRRSGRELRQELDARDLEQSRVGRHQREAKVYLDTPHHEVPGYVPLDADDRLSRGLQLGLALESRCASTAGRLPEPRRTSP